MMIHIYAPHPIERVAKIEACPCCKQRSVFVGWFVEWYGWDQTCLRCGDSWSDGELRERPFVRGWRQKSIDSARKYFKSLSLREVA
jgi:hypothetical protein